MLKIGKRRNPLGSLSSFSSRHRFDGGAEVLRDETQSLFSRIVHSVFVCYGQKGDRTAPVFRAELRLDRATLMAQRQLDLVFLP